MSERNLVLMGGAPGSGTSRLGKAIEQQLLEERLPSEHISIGARIRDIGTGLVRSAFTAVVVDHLNTRHVHEPIDDEIMFNLVSETLRQYDDRQVVLLDGYPRYEPQVSAVQELAANDQRQTPGMIVTTVDTETSLIRMIKRGQKNLERALSLDEAIDRLAEYATTFPQALRAIAERDIPIVPIDTSGSKETTNQLGLVAVRRFLQMPGAIPNETP